MVYKRWNGFYLLTIFPQKIHYAFGLQKYVRRSFWGIRNTIGSDSFVFHFDWNCGRNFLMKKQRVESVQELKTGSKLAIKIIGVKGE